MSDLRTPLSRVRGLGSAKEGTDHFWKQRLTSVANVPLILFFLYFLVRHNGSDHETLLASLSHPVIAILLLLVLVSGLLHMKLGMQTIIEDYIHSEGTKIVLLMLNSFFAIAIGVACVFSLLKIGFGG
ncbi:MAG: succinate dehydrogenase, hydrophobic membrane anchor protein [Pseudomonadota bacterium]